MNGWMDGWSAYFDVNNFQPQGRDCILRILVHCDKADSEPPLSAPQYLNIVWRLLRNTIEIMSKYYFEQYWLNQKVTTWLCKNIYIIYNLLFLIRVHFQGLGMLPTRQSTRKRKSQFPLSSQHSLPGQLVSQHFHSTVVKQEWPEFHTYLPAGGHLGR